MYKFCYYYVNPKYAKNTNFCYMDADSFIVHVKRKIFVKDIAEDNETFVKNNNCINDR